MNGKRVEKYAEGLNGIRYLEWLELQKHINRIFKVKTERLMAELNLELEEKEGGGYGISKTNNENVGAEDNGLSDTATDGSLQGSKANICNKDRSVKAKLKDYL